MILVDTSVWIDHLRQSDPILVDLLRQEQVVAHPFVIGELAMGNLRNRADVLRAMEGLPQAAAASHADVLSLVATHGLFGRGLGYVDVDP